MKQHLTERAIKAMVPEIDRDLLVYDDEVTSFAICVYRSGKRAFVLRYRIAGRARHFTIGSWPDWSVTAAREEAKRLKREVDAGNDPLGNRIDHRNAPTMSDLIDRYLREHAVQLAPRSFSDRTSLLRKLVEPEWGTRKVADITPEDVDRLLAKISKGRPRPRKHPPKPSPRRPEMKGARFGPTPVRANRVGEILRKMFNLAIKWKMRDDNPASGFRRNPENEREYFLTLPEIDRLASALAEDEDQRGTAIIRMCLLTGARLGEVRCARFEEFNLHLMYWMKQATNTKQRKVHRRPISQDVAAIVRERRAAVPPGCPWLFPGDAKDKDQPVQDLRKFWDRVRKKAGLPRQVRIHDLRHTFASLVAGDGASLLMIGKLLGHTQSKTTERYAHLVDQPLRSKVNTVAEVVKPRLRVVG